MQSTNSIKKMKKILITFFNNINSLVGVSVQVRRFSLDFIFRLFVSDLPFFIGISNSIYYDKQKINCKSSEQ